MEPIPPHSIMVLTLVLFAGCSGCGIQPTDDTRPVATNPDKKAISLVIEPRRSVTKLTDDLHFDVIVENQTADTVKVPYIYDSFIEIDGNLYTQFPKPKLIGESKRVIQGHSKASHGTVTLNGKAFATVDARTGKLPLKLVIGEHKLVLICGPYRSNAVTFRLVE